MRNSLISSRCKLVIVPVLDLALFDVLPIQIVELAEYILDLYFLVLF